MDKEKKEKLEARRREEDAIVEQFMNENNEGGWVIDGNYTSVHFERRIPPCYTNFLLAALFVQV